MEVQQTKGYKELPGYSIEWGYATWSKNKKPEDKDLSIRNRYDSEDGGFNYAGSSEVPWVDFNRMIQESIRESKFSKRELNSIINIAFKQFIKNLFKK